LLPAAIGQANQEEPENETGDGDADGFGEFQKAED